MSNPNLRGTIKELAQLDGAFVISEAGFVVAACRYLDASVEQIDLPLGLGSRHLAAASIRSAWARSPLSCPRAAWSGSSIGVPWKPRSSRNCGCSTATTRKWADAAWTSSLAVWKC